MVTLSQVNTEALAYKSYRDMLSAEDRAYIDSRERNWDFYNGRTTEKDGEGNERFCSAMVKYFKRNLGETPQEFADKRRVTLAIAAQIVKAQVNHLYGLGIARTFPEPDGKDKANTEAVKQIEKWVGGQTFFTEKLQTTAEVSGTAAIIPRFDERLRTIRFACYGGEYITPWYELGDTENLVGFEVEFYQDRMVGNKLKRGTYYERWDNRPTAEFPKGYYRVEWADEVIDEGDNPYWPLLPLVPFRAEVNPCSWYGTTTTDAVVDANEVLNEYLTEMKEIFDFQGFSTLVTIGAMPGDIPTGPKRSINVIDSGTGNADAKYIAPGAPFGEVLAWLDWWVKWTANEAQVPIGIIDASAAKVESGYALTIRWRPFLGSMTRKRHVYSDAERKLWEVAFKMANVHTGPNGLIVPLNPSEDAADKMILNWNEAVVPEDTREKREGEIHDITMGFESPITIYMKRNPGISEKDAEAAMTGNIETRDRLRAAGVNAQEKILAASAQFAEGEED